MALAIEKLRAKARVKESWLRNQRNAEAVVRDTGFPRAYVYETVRALKKEEDASVRRMTANTISEHILFGYQSRTVHFMDLIKCLQGTERKVVSMCCSMRIDYRDDGTGVTKAYCAKCSNLTREHVLTDAEAHRLYVQALDRLHKEDELLLRTAEVMGYTLKDPVPQVQQTFIMTPGAGKHGGKISAEDAQTIDDIKKMTPMDRLKLVQSLERRIVGGEDANNNDRGDQPVEDGALPQAAAASDGVQDTQAVPGTDDGGADAGEGGGLSGAGGQGGAVPGGRGDIQPDVPPGPASEAGQ